MSSEENHWKFHNCPGLLLGAILKWYPIFESFLTCHWHWPSSCHRLFLTDFFSSLLRHEKMKPYQKPPIEAQVLPATEMMGRPQRPQLPGSRGPPPHYKSRPGSGLFAPGGPGGVYPVPAPRWVKMVSWFFTKTKFSVVSTKNLSFQELPLEVFLEDKILLGAVKKSKMILRWQKGSLEILFLVLF